MSSTLTSSSQASTATITPSSGPNTRGANYFFGFLITFVALLLLFIGCGIGTRRRLQRAGGLLDFDAWDDSSGNSQPEPRFLEPTLTKGGETWSSIQPLSSGLVSKQNITSEKKVDSTSARPLPPIRLPSTNPNAIHGLSLPLWVPQQRASKEDVTENTADGKRQDEEVMQIAVLVEMPSDQGAEAERDESQLHEYQFGVAQIPWDAGPPQP
ncbi:hypothetical protein V5O48_005584 [Marasmius crinis-equi]|uniref:Uncharacterized protein n=1 Tax=Marasmius crinis-equi TaxID=585013 RepID=A0ABR3FLV4_9AGAR